MIQLFAARVCLGHLNRIDDSIQFLFIFSFFIHSFCASVLQSSEKQEQIVQAYQLTGSSIFLQARHSLVYSKRITLLVFLMFSYYWSRMKQSVISQKLFHSLLLLIQFSIIILL